MDLKTARRARRRDQYRTPKVVSALSAFRNGVKDLELSQRQYRACVARIEKASAPEREVQELLSGFMKVCTLDAGADLSKALAILEVCPEFRRRREQRQDAIRRAVRGAEADDCAALTCAERIVNGNHWLGMTWLPEVKRTPVLGRAGCGGYLKRAPWQSARIEGLTHGK